MAAHYQNVDEYLAQLDEQKRATLERLRRTIRSVAPRAEECLSYRLPAFRLDGMLVAFGATYDNCALYLMSTKTIDEHRELLADYQTDRGTICFPAEKPLSIPLVRKLVKARLAEQREREGRASQPSVKNG